MTQHITQQRSLAELHALAEKGAVFDHEGTVIGYCPKVCQWYAENRDTLETCPEKSPHAP